MLQRAAPEMPTSYHRKSYHKNTFWKLRMARESTARGFWGKAEMEIEIGMESIEANSDLEAKGHRESKGQLISGELTSQRWLTQYLKHENEH